MNSVWATTQSAVYVAMKHIFPDVPINSGCFAPMHIAKPTGTFLYAEYPRPVAGCAAEVAQRIMEAVFGAMGQAIPERMFASPAGTSGNFRLGGYDPGEQRNYIMYFFSGGGYGGWWETDGLTNGCSTVGISKTQPVEILEQHYPILFEEYALREGLGRRGRHRGGFGVNYRVRMLRGERQGIVSHGSRSRTARPDCSAAAPGATKRTPVRQDGMVTTPEHLSKGEGYVLEVGDWVQVRTPGGGGYGEPSERDPARVRVDIKRGYITAEEAERWYPSVEAAE